MDFFISSIPFFDSHMAVHAYRMMTHDGSKLLGAAEDFRMLGASLQTPALDAVEQIGIEPFAGDCDFFVDVGEYPLLLGMPANLKLPPEKLVCVIDRDIIYGAAVRQKLEALKRSGYRLAVEGLPRDSGAGGLETVTGIFDYIMLSFESGSFAEDLREARRHIFKIRLIITDIPDKASFDKHSGIRHVLLSGNFYSEPITEGEVVISPLKINSLHLIKQINDENFDIITAASIIERDPALSISLLRFINSITPNRSRKIESIRGAVAILGQREVRKWATVAISVSIGEDRPSEITRLSLIRAKFAENLAPAFEMGMKAGSLFITGLFSLLDVILQMPMEDAIEEVAVDEEIKNALVKNKGRLYEVLSLIRAYERADWHNASIIMVRNAVDIGVLSGTFMDALLWYKQLLDSIDEELLPGADAQSGQ